MFIFLFLGTTKVTLHNSQLKIILIYLILGLVEALQLSYLKQALLGPLPLRLLLSDWLPLRAEGWKSR